MHPSKLCSKNGANDRLRINSAIQQYESSRVMAELHMYLHMYAHAVKPYIHNNQHNLLPRYEQCLKICITTSKIINIQFK